MDAVRMFWNEHPVAEAALGQPATDYDYFREFDNLRESEEVEPRPFSNAIHGYDRALGLRVLDYGCGNGYVLAQYARHGAEVVGVDVAPRAIELARRRFALLGLAGTFAVGDGMSIPVDSESVDIACSMGVLHHVPDPTPIIRELHRVLRPGGELITMVYNRRSFRYHVTFRYRQRFGGPEFRGRRLEEIANMNDGRDCPWVQPYTRAELEQLLAPFEAHAFTIAKLPRAELAQWSARGERVAALVPQRAVQALGARFGWNLYCVCRKPG